MISSVKLMFQEAFMQNQKNNYSGEIEGLIGKGTEPKWGSLGELYIINGQLDEGCLKVKEKFENARKWL